MKNIVIKKLEKYADEEHEEVVFSVYKNKAVNYYTFAFEYELEEGEGQYPLEDLLDKFSVSCHGDYYGEEFEENGVKKAIVEVITSSDSVKELIDILSLSTIIDKQVNNFTFKTYEYLGINYGDAKIIINDNENIVPIYATRNVRNETETFCMKYPEGQLSSMFKKGYDISEHINGDIELKYVMLDDSKAFVIYKKDNQDYQLVYDIKGFVKDELIP